MANDVRKIETGTIVFLVLQLLFVVVSAISFRSLVYRINHFDYGKMHIDESKILGAIQQATRDYLHTCQTNLEQTVESKKPTTELINVTGIVYSTLRRTSARIGSVDYGIGDYYKYGSNLFEVVYLDFDRQRLYGVDEHGDKLICCLTGPITQDRALESDRRPSSRRASGGGTDDGQTQTSL